MAVFGLPVFGERKEIEKQKIQGEEKEMKIIIVGCGKVGATLAEQLSNEGNDIVIVDKDAEKCRIYQTRVILWRGRKRKQP